MEIPASNVQVSIPFPFWNPVMFSVTKIDLHPIGYEIMSIRIFSLLVYLEEKFGPRVNDEEHVSIVFLATRKRFFLFMVIVKIVFICKAFIHLPCFWTMKFWYYIFDTFCSIFLDVSLWSCVSITTFWYPCLGWKIPLPVFCNCNDIFGINLQEVV